MSIVQEIDFKTKNGLIVKAHIEKIDKQKYSSYIHADNTNDAFITSMPFVSSTAEECFRKLLNSTEKIISVQFSVDDLEVIDNICNCPFLSKDQEELICSPSIKVLVNGQ